MTQIRAGRVLLDRGNVHGRLPHAAGPQDQANDTMRSWHPGSRSLARTGRCTRPTLRSLLTASTARSAMTHTRSSATGKAGTPTKEWHRNLDATYTKEDQ